MATFATKLLLCFAFLLFFAARTEASGKKSLGNNAKRVPSYLMKLYMKWSQQTKNEKIPFNATAVSAMHFSSIQKTSSNSVKMTVYMGGQKKAVTVMYDELHLFIKKPAASPKAQIFTIHVKDGLTNKLMTSQTIKLQTSGWFTIPMHLKLQGWYSNSRATNDLNVEMFENFIPNGSPVYPSIGTTPLEEPFLIVYYR